MNTTFTQPSTNYRPTVLPSFSQPAMGQGAYIARPITGGGATMMAARPAGAQPSTPGGGSFLDRIIGQVEALIERVVLNLVERVLGGVLQKLEAGLGLAPSGVDQTGVGVGASGVAGAAGAAGATGAAGAMGAGAMMLDLPPMQVTVTQTNSQNQSVLQPAAAEEGGGLLSTIFDFFGGFGDKIGSAYETIKNVGSSIFGGAGGLFNKVTSFFGF